MIAENAPYKGFVSDLDCSFSWKEYLEDYELEATRETWEIYARRMYILENGEGTRIDSVDNKEGLQWGKEHMLRPYTGTRLFMAIEILEQTAVHEARHDLESFFWLLVWIVLRHTTHDRRGGARGPTSFLFPALEDQCPDQKRGWLETPGSIKVKDNRPLTLLIQELKNMCRRNWLHVCGPVLPLTHEAVLARFDEALLFDDWPLDDAAIPVPADKEPEPETTDASETSDEAQAEEDHAATRSNWSERHPHLDSRDNGYSSRLEDGHLRAFHAQSDYVTKYFRQPERCAPGPEVPSVSPVHPTISSSRSSSKRCCADENDDSPSKRIKGIEKLK